MDSSVLDASAFYAGVPFASPETYRTTPAVLAEVSHIKGRFGAIDGLIEAGRLVVAEASAEWIERARKAAAESGDIGSLSGQDVSVLALAAELGADIVTDDYALSNAAALMGVTARPVMTGGIRRSGRWVRYCRGCGRRQPAGAAECPQCGGPLARRLVPATGGGGDARGSATRRAASSAPRRRRGAG